MLLFNAHKSNQGFTIIETLIIVVVIGILSAVAVPSFLARYNRQQVTNAMNLVEGAMQESQREAIKRSQNYCLVSFDTTNSTNHQVTGPCLITGNRELCIRRNLSGDCTSTILMRSSVSALNFNFKGRTFNTNTPPTELKNRVTVVLSHPENSSIQRCVVIAGPLGLIRTGDYSGSGTNEANCAS